MTDLNLAPDAELLGRAQAGDVAAFNALEDRYWTAALQVGAAVVGRPDPTDIATESFDRVWTALASGDGPADSFQQFLYQTVRIVAAEDVARSRPVSTPRRAATVGPTPAAASTPSPAPTRAIAPTPTRDADPAPAEALRLDAPGRRAIGATVGQRPTVGRRAVTGRLSPMGKAVAIGVAAAALTVGMITIPAVASPEGLLGLGALMPGQPSQPAPTWPVSQTTPASETVESPATVPTEAIPPTATPTLPATPTVPVDQPTSADPGTSGQTPDKTANEPKSAATAAKPADRAKPTPTAKTTPSSPKASPSATPAKPKKDAKTSTPAASPTPRTAAATPESNNICASGEVLEGEQVSTCS